MLIHFIAQYKKCIVNTDLIWKVCTGKLLRSWCTVQIFQNFNTGYKYCQFSLKIVTLLHLFPRNCQIPRFEWPKSFSYLSIILLIKSDVPWMGVRFKRARTYVYLCVIHIVVWQKPTEHCEAIILWCKNKVLIEKSGPVPSSVTHVLSLETAIWLQS